MRCGVFASAVSCDRRQLRPGRSWRLPGLPAAVEADARPAVSVPREAVGVSVCGLCGEPTLEVRSADSGEPVVLESKPSAGSATGGLFVLLEGDVAVRASWFYAGMNLMLEVAPVFRAEHSKACVGAVAA